MTVLQTFELPEAVTGSPADIDLARCLIRAWQTDGIFQIATNEAQGRKTANALSASRRFFQRPMQEKARCISDLSYSGFIASGEEITAGEADYSEIFTVCKDVAPDDARVHAQWPCHGPAPWPDPDYKEAMKVFMAELGVAGEKLLKLTALGLGLDDMNALTRLTQDGWHHMRVLRFPTTTARTSPTCSPAAIRSA